MKDFLDFMVKKLRFKSRRHSVESAFTVPKLEPQLDAQEVSQCGDALHIWNLHRINVPIP